MNEFDREQKDNMTAEESKAGNTTSSAEVSYTDTLKNTNFYTENFNKPARKKVPTILQLGVVAIVSSIIGGGLVAAMLMFVAPALKSDMKGLFGRPEKSNVTTITGEVGTNQSQTLRKIEITKSETPVTAIAEKVGPSVVGIKVTVPSQDTFFSNSTGTGEGSGIIITNDGYIMTNNHVISGALDPLTG